MEGIYLGFGFEDVFFFLVCFVEGFFFSFNKGRINSGQEFYFFITS